MSFLSILPFFRSESTSDLLESGGCRLPDELKKFQMAEPNCSRALYEVFRKNWERLPDYENLSQKIFKSLISTVATHGIPPEFTLKRHPVVGWGLFVAPGQMIAAKKIIGIYAGRVMLVNPRTPKEAMRFKDEETYNFLIDSDPIHLDKKEIRALSKEGSIRIDPGYNVSKGFEIIVDASKSGNFTRFVNHSEEPNLKARCKLVKCKGGSQIVVVFIAKRTLFENEPLLLNYGPGYWKGKGILPERLLASDFV